MKLNRAVFFNSPGIFSSGPSGISKVLLNQQGNTILYRSKFYHIMALRTAGGAATVFSTYPNLTSATASLHNINNRFRTKQ